MAEATVSATAPPPFPPMPSAAPSPEAGGSPMTAAAEPMRPLHGALAPGEATPPPEAPPPPNDLPPSDNEQANSAALASGEKVASKGTTDNSNPFNGLGMSSGKGPTNIDSDQFRLDYNQKIATYIGHVKVTQPNGMMTSDKLKVTFGENMHDIKMAYADGNVRISQGDRWATGDHAVLNQTAQTVVLTGSPVVHDGEDQITGSKITVYLKTGQSVVEHARTVIFPKNGQGGEGGGDNEGGGSTTPAAQH
jgi:lipopolysaccharide transport protein LptA